MALYVDIYKRLGSFELKVKFEAENEVVGLLGASGSGKSITLKCIAGIMKPDKGKIVLNGRVLFDSEKKINLTPQKRRVGYLFQQYALFPNMTVEQNIIAGVRNLSGTEAKKEVAEYINIFKLNGLEKKYPKQLSGGEQQRVALARILINKPELLLLDEPFTALDSFLKWQLESELCDTLNTFSKTAVFVSHNRDEVYRICDSVCVLSNGNSEDKVTVDELFISPKTRNSALLTGCKNFSDISLDNDGYIELTDWGIKIKPEYDVTADIKYAGIYSKDIKIGDRSEEETVQCEVASVYDDISRTAVIVRISEKTILHIECDKEAGEYIKGKKEIFIKIPTEKIMLLK